MTKGRLVSSNVDDQGAQLQFEGADRAALAQELTNFFASKNYRLEKGDPLDGVWGTGNAALRILFGAFVKRYKFNVVANGTGDHLTLTLSKGMSGVSGGVIGMSKMKKEVQSLASAMQSHFK